MPNLLIKNIYFIFIFFTFLIININIYPQTPREYLEKGIYSYNEELYLEAENYLKNAISLNPYYGDAYKYLAYNYLKLNRLNDAISNVNKAIVYNKSDHENYILAGDIYLKNNETKKAQEMYNLALNINPSDWRVYLGFARYYMKINDLKQTKDFLDKAERLKNNSLELFKTKAEFSHLIGNTNDEERFYKLAIEANPYNRDIYIDIAKFYLKNKDYNIAIKYLEDARKIFNNFIAGSYLLLDIYLKLNNYNKIIEISTWLLENDYLLNNEKKAFLYFCLGEAYCNLDTEKAKEFYNNAIDLDNNNELYLVSFEEKILNNIINDDDDEIKDKLSVIKEKKAIEEYKKGNNNLYLINIKRALLINPFNISARTNLIAYYESLKDFVNAYKELKILYDFDKSSKTKTKLENYEWRIKNSKIKTNDYSIYKYNIMVFFRNTELYDYNKLYDYLISVSKNFGKLNLIKPVNALIKEEREIFSQLNNISNSIYMIISYNDNIISYEIRSVNNSLIHNNKKLFYLKNLTLELNNLLMEIDNILPDLYEAQYIKNDTVITYAGKNNRIKAEDYLGFIPDGNVDNTILLKVDTLEPYFSKFRIDRPGKNYNFEKLLIVNKKEYENKKNNFNKIFKK